MEKNWITAIEWQTQAFKKKNKKNSEYKWNRNSSYEGKINNWLIFEKKITLNIIVQIITTKGKNEELIDYYWSAIGKDQKAKIRVWQKMLTYWIIKSENKKIKRIRI